jgi:hypothetical protein
MLLHMPWRTPTHPHTPAHTPDTPDRIHLPPQQKPVESDLAATATLSSGAAPHRPARENIKDFLAKKREIFLVQVRALPTPLSPPPHPGPPPCMHAQSEYCNLVW